MLADFTAESEVFFARGAARMCATLTNHSTARPWDEDYRAAASKPSNGEGRRCDPLAAPVQQHSELLPGNQRGEGPLIPVRLHRNCSHWVEERYRVCADVLSPDGLGWGGEWNVFYLKGRWYRQHYVNTHPEGLIEGAFFHFQACRVRHAHCTRLLPLPGMPVVSTQCMCMSHVSAS